MEPLSPLPSERLLIENLPRLEGNSAVVVSPGRAQFANHLASDWAFGQVQAWFLDLYSAAVTGLTTDERVEIVCSADLPAGEFDLVAMPVLKKSESELTRDLMQQAHQRLVTGGHIAMAVDNPKDQWVHEQMQSLFAKVSCHRSERGCVYWAKKTSELKKQKSYDCEFVLRDEQQLVKVLSRPGVFSHRRVDPGARQLLLAAEIAAADNVLDMGCGAGTLSLAVAFKTTGTVHGADSNARAVECVERGAQLNGLSNVKAHLNADGQFDFEHPIDVALANPPYYGDDAISAHFVDSCIAVLRPGGALLVVTKSPSWYESYFLDRLEDIAVFEASQYFICCGRRAL